jgi:hypothetical protein
MVVTGRLMAGLAFDWTESNLPYFLALVVVLLIGAAAVALVKRWRQKTVSETMSPSEQLAEYRSLYDQGVMSKDEYDRLRALLGAQLREVKTKAPDPMAAQPKAAVDIQPPAAQPPANANGVAAPPSADGGPK